MSITSSASAGSLRALLRKNLPTSAHCTSRTCRKHLFDPTFSTRIRTISHLRQQNLKVKLASSKPPTASSPTNIAAQRSQAIAKHFSTTTPDSMNLYTYSKTPSPYTPRTIGQPFTTDYRCYIEKDGQPVSPFHDIPLYANEQQTILNMIVEIPRWSNAKQEVTSRNTTVRTKLITDYRSRKTNS